MKVTGWKGGTYGIRVGRKNAQKYFSRNGRNIGIEIDGEIHTFFLSDTFWTTCPEFRGTAIGDWLLKNRLVPWPRGNPPELNLTPLGNNRFRLSRD